ncbi:MAG TPA: beta-galactosidase [Stellaceae bacterium]|nr:beta-galactosidase [Stellaceae bacterium]
MDGRRVVATLNKLHTHLALDSVDRGGTKDHREADETAFFAVAPADAGWTDYQIIMWQPQTAAQYAALKRLGVTAGVVELDHAEEGSTPDDDEVAPLLEADLRWYVENIATDFYSPYHRWLPDQPKNWNFLAAKKLYRQNPSDPAAFTRSPSLSDADWLAKIRARLARTVQNQRGYRPLYYNLGDEAGIADLSAFWDFDLSPSSIAGMRKWLEGRYGSLFALNEQWGTAFAGWDEVVPMTTQAAIKRADGNYSAWADFKEWMDVAFARALRAGTEAVHAVDPEALAAIEALRSRAGAAMIMRGCRRP